MEKETRYHYHTRGSTRGTGGPGSNTGGHNNSATDRDLLLQWGYRKRVRCTKTQQREDSTAFTKPPVTPAPNQTDRRVLRRVSPNSIRSLRKIDSDMDGQDMHWRGFRRVWSVVLRGLFFLGFLPIFIISIIF